MSKEFDLREIVESLTEHKDEPNPRSGQPTEEQMHRVLQKYLDNLNNPDPNFFRDNFSEDYRYEDPVGAGNLAAEAMAERFSPQFFTLDKGELISPISTSFGSSAAMAFRVFAQVDGRKITIDIVDVMTFDEAGKITEVKAYWGAENVKLAD